MIAEVALGLPVRRIFDYRVPDAWLASQAALIGARVIVPFGSRLRGGIVVALKERSEIAEERLKTAHQLTEGPPLFTPEGLAFTRWVSDYYLCGWGEVLEAALPSGLGVKIRTWYRLREDAAGRLPHSASSSSRLTAPGCLGNRLSTFAERDSSPSQIQAPLIHTAERRPEEDSPSGGEGAVQDAGLLAVLSAPARRLVAAHREWDGVQWLRVASPADQAWLRRQMRPGGAVALRQEFAGTRAKARLEKWIRLAHPGTSVEAQEPLLRKRRNALRESKRERILRLLQEEGEAPLARVKAALGSPGAAIRRLREEGLVAEMLRPGARRDPFGPPPPRQDFLALTAEQEAAAAALRDALGARIYQGFLLQGVTGSGKTEVYLHAVRETLAQGRTALVLVPEIALTAEMVNRFRARFGDEVAVLHSGLGAGERFDEWSRIRAGDGSGRGPDGNARIVIGARSAVFAPLADLGLVIVDEEHDGSYKQDESPRYHARDAAIWRASRAAAVLVLGSATPSLESVRNVEVGKLTRLRLGSRIERRPLPPVELVDLRTVARVPGAAAFGVPLAEAVRDTLARQEQAILFLNRRGFASLVRCGACQAPVLCANCSLALTWHQGERRLRCHRCDYSRAMPETCAACGAAAMKSQGLGTERIAQELSLLFPQARVLRVDSDSLRRRGELERVMAAIGKHQYDLIIGTQILSKGHDFPRITLVGAVLADVALNLPDFRAPERCFQLLTQMAGRAGRGDRPGRVLIQTYNPGHYALTHVLTHDVDAFAAEELSVRERAAAPPFSSQVLLWISSPSARDARRLADAVAERVRGAAGLSAPGNGAQRPNPAAGLSAPRTELFAPRASAQATRPAPGVEVLGPAEAPIQRLAGRFRWMLLLKGPRIAPLQRLARQVLDDPGLKGGAGERIAVDVDPYHLL